MATKNIVGSRMELTSNELPRSVYGDRVIVSEQQEIESTLIREYRSILSRAAKAPQDEPPDETSQEKD